MRVRNRYKPGDHLVTTSSGSVEYASETTLGKHGAQKGHVVLTKDLDEPGRNSGLQAARHRTERNIKPITGEPTKIWRARDENGDIVSGGPFDN